MQQEPALRWPPVTGLLLLFIRGVALWLVLPLAFVVWLSAWPLWRRRGVLLRQMLGWADLNLVAAIQRTILRPLVRKPLTWTPVAELPHVTHRVSLLDPV